MNGLVNLCRKAILCLFCYPLRMLGPLQESGTRCSGVTAVLKDWKSSRRPSRTGGGAPCQVGHHSRWRLVVRHIPGVADLHQARGDWSAGDRGYNSERIQIRIGIDTLLTK